jgi:tetratricopeptide (TPR) repeat protein
VAGEDSSLSFDDVELVAERELGSLGRVFVVRRKKGQPAPDPDPWLGLPVLALRPLVADENESDEAVARLRVDAVALASLEHPNLLRVVGIGKRRDADLVAIECPSSREAGLPARHDLAALIARHEFPLGRAVVVARECASALGAVASAGRPHADLRDSCVFVPELSPATAAGERDGGPGGAKLVPFALPPDYRVEHRASPLAFYRGLPNYAAPELHRDGGRNPTEKSNIFAFGVLLYEMLTGQLPFRGGTSTRILLDVHEGTPSPPSSHSKRLGHDIPADLDRICMRCLEKDPERRFPTFAAVEASLRIAGETAAPAVERPSTRPLASGSPATTVQARAARSAVRRATPGLRRIGIIVAAAIVAIAALALILLSREDSSEYPAGDADERTVAAYEALRRANDLIGEGKHREAMLLLESHAHLRDVDADAYDRTVRRAKARRLRRLAETSEGTGNWQAALESYEELIALGESGEDLETSRDGAAFRAAISLARKSSAAGEWEDALKVLEEASTLVGRITERYLQGTRLEHDLALARSMKRARIAQAEGDGEAERERLFEALRLEPGHPGVEARLAEISAGPDASAEALGEARAALDEGDLEGAQRWATEAHERWPDDPAPGEVLAYLGDNRFCEESAMALVSPNAFEGTWDEAERAKAFCIDRYEYPGREGELPVTRVSAVEAAAMCAKRGSRLCSLAEWRLACGGREGLAYPYGDEYVGHRCNTEGTGLAPAGSRPECRSPFGVYDMSGNVAEWTAEGADESSRYVAGGDWSGSEAFTRSDAVVPFNPGLTSPRVGFRCCRMVTTPERDEPPGLRGAEND